MPRLIPRTICNSTTNWVKSNYCNDGTITTLDDLAVDISKWTGNPTLLNWNMLKINDFNVPNGLILIEQINGKHSRVSFPTTDKPIVDMSKFLLTFPYGNMPEWGGWALFRYVKCDKMINIKLCQDGDDNFSNSMWNYDLNAIHNWCPYIHFADGYNKIRVTSSRSAYINFDNNGSYATTYAGLSREIHNLDFSEVPSNYLLTDLAMVNVLDVKNVHCNVNLTKSVMEREAIVDFFKNGLDKITNTRTITLGSTLLAKLTADDIKIATDKGWTLA